MNKNKKKNLVLLFVALFACNHFVTEAVVFSPVVARAAGTFGSKMVATTARAVSDAAPGIAQTVAGATKKAVREATSGVIGAVSDAIPVAVEGALKNVRNVAVGVGGFVSVTTLVALNKVRKLQDQVSQLISAQAPTPVLTKTNMFQEAVELSGEALKLAEGAKDAVASIGGGWRSFVPSASSLIVPVAALGGGAIVSYQGVQGYRSYARRSRAFKEFDLAKNADQRQVEEGFMSRVLEVKRTRGNENKSQLDDLKVLAKSLGLTADRIEQLVQEADTRKIGQEKAEALAANKVPVPVEQRVVVPAQPPASSAIVVSRSFSTAKNKKAKKNVRKRKVRKIHKVKGTKKKTVRRNKKKKYKIKKSKRNPQGRIVRTTQQAKLARR